MNPSTPNPVLLSFAARARLRLFVTLLASLVLHLSLILGLQFGSVEHGQPAARVIEARLTPSAPKTAEQPVLLKAMDRIVKSDIQDWTPPPVPATPPPATQPAPKPTQEDYRPGMSKDAAGATTVDVPLPVDTTYYSAREVDEHPSLVSGGRPVYPQAASDASVKGEVLVLFMLNENGVVEEANVIEAKPPNQGFEEAVLEWLKQSRFKPAVRKGRTVKSRVVYRVHFDP